MKNGLIIKAGIKFIYKDNKLHNDIGPAVEFPSGTKWWCNNGKWHNTEGPAIENADGTFGYWVNGKCLSFILSNIKLTKEQMELYITFM